MKRSTMRRMLVLCLCLCLVTCSLVGGTLAKYTASFDGESTARVAKWAFTVDEADIATKTFSFDLFEGLATETGVKAGTNEVIIAPGTSGSFNLVLTNGSEVAAKYSIEFTESENNTIPVQYSVDGKTWNDEVSALNVSDVELGFGEVTDDNTDTITIQWRWVFEGTTAGAHVNQTDTSDTTLGTDAATNTPASVTVSASVTVEQIDTYPTTK